MNSFQNSGAAGSTTALEELVVCQCGHAIGLHDTVGCRGIRPRSCACAKDRNWVLDAAIAQSIAEHRASLR